MLRHPNIAAVLAGLVKHSQKLSSGCAAFWMWRLLNLVQPALLRQAFARSVIHLKQAKRPLLVT
jgi:hypothetical protein